MQLEEAKALAILEFINAEQFPGQIRSALPFLKGYAAWLGIPCVWVRFALESAHFYSHGKDAVTLSDSEQTTLAELLSHMQQKRGLLPDLVVTTHTLSEGVTEELLRLMPGVHLKTLDALESGREWPKGPLPTEMDRPGFQPDYGWFPGNPAARRHDRNNVYILGSVGCGYRKSVRSNPAFEGLDIPESLMGGCSFCGARVLPGEMLEALEAGGEQCPAEIRAWRQLIAGTFRVPQEQVARQIRAVAQTLAPQGVPNALLFADIERPDVLECAVATLALLPELAGVKLLAGLRVDRLLQLEEWLVRTFASGGQSADFGVPSLQVFSCGIESFVDEELRRFNKGTTALMNLRAVNLLKELELGSGGRFYYSGYMGLSVLFFTPWTTVESLDLNVGLLLALQLENEVGNLFLSRMRLHPDLAITLLARRDGVVVEAEEDAALMLNRRKLFEQELPWRHLDGRMEAVSKIAVRLEPDSRLEGDPLYQQVQQRLVTPARLGAHGESRGVRRRVLVRLLKLVVEAAASAGAALTPDELLDLASSRLPADSDLASGPKVATARWRTVLEGNAPAWGPELGAGDALVSDLSEEEGAWAVVRVARADSTGLDYTPTGIQGGGAAFAASGLTSIHQALLRGNRLEFHPGQVRVLRDGKVTSVWTANLSVYVPGTTWHEAEWKQLARAVCRESRPETEAARNRVRNRARTWIADPVILGGSGDA